MTDMERIIQFQSNEDLNQEMLASKIVSDAMWSPVESGGAECAAPCARGKHSATLLGGFVYVLGGRGAGGAVPLRDFWRYCLAAGRWERLQCRGEPPPSLQEHSAIAHEDKLYVFGGEAGTLSTETPLWIYDTQSEVWRKLAGAAPSAGGRAGGSAGGRAGGSAGGRAGGRWRVPAPAPGPRGRRGHSAHALKDCLLIYGGYRDLRGSTHELWAFHYESESWQQVRTAGAGPARHRHAAALHGARLYVHGGQSDLRACADLWHYDTMSRVWSPVRGARGGPGARSGHAALSAAGHLYVFGGEAAGTASNELWRFHYATETWERIEQGLKWPSPRVDCCALLVSAPPPRVRSAPAAPAPGARPEPPASLLRELSKLSSFHIRRSARCSYSVLGERDSTESLPREASLPKSRSAYVLARRPGPRGAAPPPAPARDGAPAGPGALAREPISVPDFADMILPTPVLSPVEATKLVYLDSDEEEDARREYESSRRGDGGPGPRTIVAFPESASVRFTEEPAATDDEGELSTSDYASAERVNRPPGAALGFSNPHYLGPDVRQLGLALTPDSGVGAGDLELRDLAPPPPPPAPAALHLLLVGGREPHAARLQGPLSMWSLRLL